MERIQLAANLLEIEIAHLMLSADKTAANLMNAEKLEKIRVGVETNISFLSQDLEKKELLAIAAESISPEWERRAGVVLSSYQTLLEDLHDFRTQIISREEQRTTPDRTENRSVVEEGVSAYASAASLNQSVHALTAQSHSPFAIVDRSLRESGKQNFFPFARNTAMRFAQDADIPYEYLPSARRIQSNVIDRLLLIRQKLTTAL